MKNPTEQDIEKAIADFDNKMRPNNFRNPDWWYVYSKAGKIYPAKAIWALATQLELGEFNTTEARSGFKKLGYQLYNDKEAEQLVAFEKAVSASLLESAEVRQQKLNNANKTPSKYVSEVIRYRRNPDVVAEVLLQANGRCAKCDNTAPFIRKSDGSGFLEVHHKVPLAKYGEDSVENAEALCPNCHREKHYGVGY